ncbi:MAG: hypothetical protein ABSB97_06115, partial [Thermoplasmata archaeon]
AYALRESPLERVVFAFPVPLGIFQAGLLTGLLSLDVAFLWWTGMQVLPTFLSSGVLPVLETLPIDDRTLGRAAGLLYLRLFDLPALTVLVATPVLVGFSLGPWAGLAVLPGALAAVGFAIALSLVTGRFFVRRVQGSRGGGGSTVVRWAYLVLWLVPAFAMFGFVTAAPAFFGFLGRLSTHPPSLAGHLLLGAFPFSFATLPAVVSSGPAGFGLDPVGWLFLAAASVGYLLLAAWSVLRVFGSVRHVSVVPPSSARSLRRPRLDLAPQPVMLAVLTKDLRVASRTPGFAFLILLPILDALVLGLWTYVRVPGSAVASGLALAAVTIAALLATFFGPAFFAIEVLAYSYGRTLPLSDRSLLGGKVLLVALMYLVASGVVLGVTLTRVFDPLVFSLFVAAELPAVVAAALLELGILFRRARARGLPITNLYAGAWYAVIVSIPGLVVAAAPLVAFQLARSGGSYAGLFAMGLIALGELALAVPFALGRGDS